MFLAQTEQSLQRIPVYFHIIICNFIMGIQSSPNKGKFFYCILFISMKKNLLLVFIDCYWLLSALLEYTAYNNLVPMFTGQDHVSLTSSELPVRMEGK